ncbi:hypothetical protein Pst134EA_004690 [Puccinia striiformis f. sp. tritici]|uniref:hypothetical protein n=1 Tax=Puccinia striiformis f. sp. tritici TaxID=168172 RepID=UPI002008EAF6|nr:hypothetical protein Pst134EA_004690 [Puccinia striiformis f. sp. tritici]KAH9470764.1 hypothetical protein Pst134EA_004690 [Puccinia striiformis f. sp. tritici]
MANNHCCRYTTTLGKKLGSSTTNYTGPSKPNSVVISPAVLAVRDRGLDPISSPRIITVNGFVVSSSHRNPFLHHTPWPQHSV